MGQTQNQTHKKNMTCRVAAQQKIFSGCRCNVVPAEANNTAGNAGNGTEAAGGAGNATEAGGRRKRKAWWAADHWPALTFRK